MASPAEIDSMFHSVAAILRHEAEIARTSPHGRHPKVSVMTHAAALRYAADLVESFTKAEVAEQ